MNPSLAHNFRRLAHAVLAAAFLALAGGAAAQVGTGDAFPPLPASAKAAAAGRVALVDFWATWCAPCKASFPVYARLYRDFSDRGLAIVGVCVDESPAQYAAFVAKAKPPFATVLDDGQRLVKAVQVPTMPTSYVLDRTGKVRFVHAGFHGSETDAQLRREIEQLLRE